jgi:hypothetical protein
MNEGVESKVIEKFRESLSRAELSEEIRITYRVAGGMPHERLEHEVTLTGGGNAQVKMGDELKAIPPQEASGTLDLGETRDLLEQVGVSLEDLVPRSEAQFVPDSVVGSITLEIDGEETTLFFLPDEEQRVAWAEARLPDEEKSLASERVAASPLTQTIKRFAAVSERLLQGAEESGDE